MLVLRVSPVSVRDWRNRVKTWKTQSWKISRREKIWILYSIVSFLWIWISHKCSTLVPKWCDMIPCVCVCVCIVTAERVLFCLVCVFEGGNEHFRLVCVFQGGKNLKSKDRCMHSWTNYKSACKSMSPASLGSNAVREIWNLLIIHIKLYDRFVSNRLIIRH